MTKSHYSVITILLPLCAVGQTAIWQGGGGGGGGDNWTNNGNWIGTNPNAAGAIAQFPGTAGRFDVELNSNRTVGQMQVDSATSYLFDGGNTLTFDNSGTDAVFSVTGGGSHTFSMLSSLADTINFDIDTGSTLTVTNNLTGTGGVQKSGGGTLIIPSSAPANSTFSGDNLISEGRLSIGTSATPVTDGIVFGATSSGENSLGVGDTVVESGAEFFVYSDASSDAVEFRNNNTIEDGGRMRIETSGGSDNEIQFYDEFDVGRNIGSDAELFAWTGSPLTSDADILFAANSTFESLGDICIIASDDIEFRGNVEINGGNLLFVAFDDFETSQGVTPGDARLSVTGGAQITVLTSYQYTGVAGTSGFVTTGGSGSQFELRDNDVIRVEDTGSRFDIYANDDVIIQGDIIWDGGNEFRVLRSGGIGTFLDASATLDGGSGSEQGTFLISGDLIVENTSTLINNPNITITTLRYDQSVTIMGDDCPEFTPFVETTSTSSTVSGASGGGTDNLTGIGTFAKQGAGTTNLTLDSVGAQVIAVEEGTLTTDKDNLIVAGADLEIGTSSTSGTLDISDDDHSFNNIEITQGNIYTDTGTLTITGDTVTKEANGTAGVIATDAGQSGLASVVLTNSEVTFDIGDDGTAASDLTIAGNVTGTSNVTKTGDGTLTITGTSAHSGSTTINGGTLDVQELDDNAAVIINNSGSELVINDNETIGSLAGNGGTVTMGSNDLTAGGNGDNTTFAGDLSGSGTFTKTGSGEMTLSGSSSLTGDVVVSGGSLLVDNNSGSALGSINDIQVNTGAEVLVLQSDQFNTNASLTLNGGSFAFDQSSGTTSFNEEFANLFVTDDSTIAYAGDSAILTFNGGNFGSGDMLDIDTWDGSITGGGAHQFIIDTSLVADPDLDINFTGYAAGFETIALGGGLFEIVPTFDDSKVFTWTGGTDNAWDDNGNWTSTPENDFPQEAGDYAIFNNTGSGETSVELTGDRTIGYLEFAESTSYTLNDDGSTRSINFDTDDGLAARMTLSGSGTQTINVDLENDDGDGLIIAQNSTGGLILDGDLNSNGNDVIVRGAEDTTLNGALTGSGGLTKSGSGTLTIESTTNNSFSGDVAVDSGDLIIAGSDSLGTGSNAITVGSASANADARLLSKNSGVDLDQDIDIIASPQATVLGGTHSSGTSTFSGDIDLGQNATLTAATGGTVEFTGEITGSNGLDKIGGGRVILDDGSNTNSFSGASTIQEGTLQANTATSLGSLGSNAWTMSEGTDLELNYSTGTGLNSGNVIVNGGAAGSTIERTATGGTDTNLLSTGGTLTANGITNLVNTGSGGGALNIGGTTNVTSGATLNLVTSSANSSEISFNGSGESISIAAGGLVQTSGGGRIDFGGSNAITIEGQGTAADLESRLVLDDLTDFSNGNNSTILEVNGADCFGLEIEGSASQLTSMLDLGTANSRLDTLTGSGGTLTLRTTTNGLTIEDGPTSSSNVSLGIGSNSSSPSTITVTLDNTGSTLDNYAGVVVRENSANTESNPQSTGDLTALTRVELVGGDLDLTGQADSQVYVKEGILDLNSNDIDIAGTATIEKGDLVGDASSTLTADTIRFNAPNSFTSTVGITLDTSAGTEILLDGGTVMFDGGSIANGSNVDMSGGLLDLGTFAQTGDGVTLGTLTLSEVSRLNFGENDHSLTFANSRDILWVGGAGDFLYIEEWAGDVSGGGNDQLLFQNAPMSQFGVNDIQLAQIRFINPAGFDPGVYDSRILTSGEIVPGSFVAPVPEPSTYLMGGVLATCIGIHYYRRRRKRAAAAG
ncbi:MAG: autotransporter-associated beta strand repeat-containing protein [Verrucomicrobiota bacterium]